MKKHYYLIIICFVMILIPGCLGNNNNNQSSIDSLDIHISNGANKTYEVNIIITNSQNDIVFNETVLVNSSDQKDFTDITDQIDEYKLTIMLDDGRVKISNDIAVNEFRHQVSVHIDNSDINISQKIE